MLKGFAHAVFKTKFFGSGLTLHDGNSLIERLEIDGSNLMMISLRYLLFFIFSILFLFIMPTRACEGVSYV